MIKAILVIFEPAATWDKVVQARPSFKSVFFLHLVPLILVSVGAEILGLVYLGRRQEMGDVMKIPEKLVIAYAVAEVVLSFAMVFVGAKLIKSVAETFHGRHTFTQSFTVTAYALGPFFLVRMLDAFPVMNPWVSFGIGMFLVITVLYSGIPRILDPDPPHAFGLYLISSLLVAMVCGLARFVMILVILGKIPALQRALGLA